MRARKAPNRRKLTDANVTALPLKRQPYHVWDERQEGLGVLVRPSGIRTYRCAWNYPNGPTKVFALGRVDDIDLDEARRRCAEARRLARDGKDPQAGDPRDTESFKTAVEKWTTQEQQDRKGLLTADRTQAYVLAVCKRWRDRPLGMLSYPEIEDLLTEYRRKHPHGANRIHAHLKQMFRWAVRTKRIVASPMTEMPMPWLGAKPRSRDWFKGDAADDMVRKLWQCANELGGDRERFMKLILLTGKRRGAIETMRWEHIGSDWYWSPTCGNKWKRCHAVPLPNLARRVLGKHGEKGRVLAPFNPDLFRKQVAKLIGVEDFFWHGCRHLVETKLGELKVPPHIRDMILDHAPLRGSGADYDHGDYREEIAEALGRWADHVARLVAPAGNVAVLR